MIIRRITSGEEEIWRNAVKTILANEINVRQLGSKIELKQSLADTRCYLYIAESGSEPLGLLSAYRFPNLVTGGYIAYLYDIAVQTGYRRKGVGKSLIQSLIKSCISDHVQVIWAGTDITNTAARCTFKATGADMVGDSYVEYEWIL